MCMYAYIEREGEREKDRDMLTFMLKMTLIYYWQKYVFRMIKMDCCS